MLSQSVQPAWLTSIWCVGSETTFWPARRSSWAPWPGPRGPRTTGIGVCWTSPRAAISGCAWTTCAAFSAWAASGFGTGVRCVGCRAILRRNLRTKEITRTCQTVFHPFPGARGGRRETNGRRRGAGRKRRTNWEIVWPNDSGGLGATRRLHEGDRRQKDISSAESSETLHGKTCRTDGEDRSGLRVGKRRATERTYASIYCVLPCVANSNGSVTRLKVGKEGQRWSRAWPASVCSADDSGRL